MDPFKVFTQQVFDAYQKMKGTADLALGLENPTVSKLRDRCLVILADKTRVGDHQLVKEFYDPENQKDILEAHIRRTNPDIMKALTKFMKGETTKTEEKNVKLLAALINFEPRPYSKWYAQYQEELLRSQQDEAPGQGVEGIENTEGGKKMDGPDVVRRNQPRRSWFTFSLQITLFCLFVAICTVVIVYNIKQNTSNGGNGCMVWTEDRYERIVCAPHTGGLTAIALDSIKVAHFRKIMQTDTITYNAIGNVWYSKIDNEVEFFTASGSHPIYTFKKLKPITMHIVDTYVYHKTLP